MYLNKNEASVAHVRKSIGKHPSFLANVAQNPSHHMPTDLAPALLRKSVLWSMPDQRVLLPLEHFEIQGYNIFGAADARCSFAEILTTLSDEDARALAGNGMHLSSTTYALMFLLSCTVHTPLAFV